MSPDSRAGAPQKAELDAPPAARGAAAETRRLAELAAGAPAALSLYSEQGTLLAQNDAARATFGEVSLAALLASPDRAIELISKVKQRGRASGEAELTTQSGRVWFHMDARATRDPVTGSFALGLSAEDLTERRSADRAKDEFISIVNHELRTPLTAARGAVGLLSNGVVDDAAQSAELFEIAWENLTRLGRLVDDLLDVQRLRLGAVDLVLATLEMAPLVIETLELLEPRAADVGVTLRLVDRAPGAVVRGDPGRLVQALSNLITNALKHAPPGSEVGVEIEQRETAVRVYVRDQGPGVPVNFVAKLFFAFSQADSTDARSRGGAGLGLYIVRTLIEAHGGSVGYDPSAARGAAFYFELPSAQDFSPSSQSNPRLVLV